MGGNRKRILNDIPQIKVGITYIKKNNKTNKNESGFKAHNE